MAEVINMPRLSDTMEEGTVSSWLKKVGDAVSEGDILAEIETDKATMEFESFYKGTLLHIGIKEGETAPVDALLAIIGDKGEDISALIKAGSEKPDKQQGEAAAVSSPEEPQAAPETEPEPETAPEIKTPEVVEPVPVTDGDRVLASPVARKLAAEKGIALSQVKGTGDSGRIVKRDVENFRPYPGVQQAYTPVGKEQFVEENNSQMRKTIARRLAESKFTAPHYYLTVAFDMDNAMVSRAAINEASGGKISFNDLVVKACAMALRKHPRVNSQWAGNTTRMAKHIHVGVAVAVEDGLVVPVLRFADQMTLAQINAEVKDMAGRARDKKLKPEEMEGSTFTVSNLGMFGIREFTSIINQPNSCILSVGAIVEKPVVRNGQVVPGHTMTVTLACDHRTVDGATGAAFLQTLKQYIENPITMFS